MENIILKKTGKIIVNCQQNKSVTDEILSVTTVTQLINLILIKNYKMISIFKIKNLANILPEFNDHEIVIDTNQICKDYPIGIEAPAPYFWSKYKIGENPYLTKNHVIQDDGWVLDKSDESTKQISNSSTLWLEINNKLDVCNIGKDKIIMFQDPGVSYAHVLYQKHGANNQVCFDLWTPYYDSINEAERAFTGYSLITNPDDLQIALDFVERNLIAFVRTLFKSSNQEQTDIHIESIIKTITRKRI